MRDAEAPDLLPTLGAAGVAKLLGMSVQTVNTWAKTDRMPAYQVGRSWIVFRAEIQAWLESTSTDPHRDRSPVGDPLASLPPLLSPAETAALLWVSAPTLNKMLDSGELPYFNLGARKRIETAALRSFLEGVRNDAPVVT